MTDNRRTCTTVAVAPPVLADVLPIWERTTRGDQCWLFTSQPNTTYPTTKRRPVYQVLYEADKGPRPPATKPHHLCLNKQCVRPHHVIATGVHARYHHAPTLEMLSAISEPSFCKVCHDVPVIPSRKTGCCGDTGSCHDIEHIKQRLVSMIMRAIETGKVSLDWLDLLIFLLQQARIRLATHKRAP